MLLRAVGEDGRDAGDAEFGGLLDRPFEVVELEDSEQQMDGQRGVGLEFLVQGEADFRVGDGGDLRAVEEAVGDDVVDLARPGAEHARKMGGLLSRERGAAGMAGLRRPGVGNEAAAHGRKGTRYSVPGTRFLGWGR